MPKNDSFEPKKGQNQKNDSPKPISVSQGSSEVNKKAKKSIMDNHVQ